MPASCARRLESERPFTHLRFSLLSNGAPSESSASGSTAVLRSTLSISRDTRLDESWSRRQGNSQQCNNSIQHGKQNFTEGLPGESNSACKSVGNGSLPDANRDTLSQRRNSSSEISLTDEDEDIKKEDVRSSLFSSPKVGRLSSSNDIAENVRVAYERYELSVGVPERLRTLLRELSDECYSSEENSVDTDSAARAECRMLQLAKLLGIPRKRLDNDGYVLTYDESVCFALWVHRQHFLVPNNPGATDAVADDISAHGRLDTALATPTVPMLPSPGDKKKSKVHIRKSARTSNAEAMQYNASVVVVPVADTPSLQERESAVKYARRLRSTRSLATTSPRDYALERRVFAQLGGLEDCVGTVRLALLRRMFLASSIEVRFDPFVGTIIDPGRSGAVTFNEFLWIVEYGVHGECPAAALHRHLSATSLSPNAEAPERTPAPAPRRRRRRTTAGQKAGGAPRGPRSAADPHRVVPFSPYVRPIGSASAAPAPRRQRSGAHRRGPPKRTPDPALASLRELRAEEDELVKKIKAFSRNPVPGRDPMKQQAKLQNAQDKLNLVLDKVGATLRVIGTGSDRGGGE